MKTIDESNIALKTKTYKAVTTMQGDAVLADFAYVAKESDSIICMCIDAWGETGRAYPEATTRTYDSVTGKTYPCIWYMVEPEDDVYTIVEFPELAGWEIFAVDGGKTCNIVLTKGKLFE